MGIEITFRNKYGGSYLTNGGSAGNAGQESTHAGASGTVYKFESSRGPQYRELNYNPRLNTTMVEPEHTMLIVDNLDLNTQQPVMVMEDNSDYYEFDEVFERFYFIFCHQFHLKRVFTKICVVEQKHF